MRAINPGKAQSFGALDARRQETVKGSLCRELSTAAVLILAVAALFFGSTAQAQVNSNTASVTLNATLTEILTVAALPTAVTFVLVAGGPVVGTPSVSVTTVWVLGSRTAVNLFGYFASSTAALTSGTNNIPTSEVFAQINGGSYSAFTATGALGPAGAGLNLYTQAITAANRASTRTDTINLKIDLTSQPQLPAGIYTGTLTLQAQAT
jgi:hypothetical protein